MLNKDRRECGTAGQWEGGMGSGLGQSQLTPAVMGTTVIDGDGCVLKRTSFVQTDIFPLQLQLLFCIALCCCVPVGCTVHEHSPFPSHCSCTSLCSSSSPCCDPPRYPHHSFLFSYFVIPSLVITCVCRTSSAKVCVGETQCQLPKNTPTSIFQTLISLYKV